MCNYCLMSKCPPGCPNYEPPKASYYCDVCGESIYDGDKYIINDNGEYAHWECVDYAIDLVKFLDYEIKTMRTNNDEY